MPFQRGQSGNPAGRAKNAVPTALRRTTRSAAGRESFRAQVGADLPMILAAVVTAAKDGDIAACRLVLERVYPALKTRDQPVNFRMPDDFEKVPEALLRSIADGKLTPDEGASMASAIAAMRKVQEVTDFERRIEILEEARSARH